MNSTSLQVFNFEESQIRTLDVNGELMWVAVDVCRALGLEQVSIALSRLEEEEVNSINLLDSRGVTHPTNIINESGLYTLILGSRKEEAKRFKRWVTSEVLPSIRKTGKYSITPVKHQFSIEGVIPTEFDGALRLAQSFGLTGNQAKIHANRAVLAFHKINCLELLGNPTLICDVQDTEMTATDIGEKLGISCQKVNKLSVELDIIAMSRDSKGRVKYIPTETGKNYCFLKDVMLDDKKTSKQQLVYYGSAVEFFKSKIK